MPATASSALTIRMRAVWAARAAVWRAIRSRRSVRSALTARPRSFHDRNVMTQQPDPGLSVAIRPVRRSDATGLIDFYAGLSPESRRRRFLTGGIPDPD